MAECHSDFWNNAFENRIRPKIPAKNLASDSLLKTWSPKAETENQNQTESPIWTENHVLGYQTENQNQSRLFQRASSNIPWRMRVRRCALVSLSCSVHKCIGVIHTFFLLASNPSSRNKFRSASYNVLNWNELKHIEMNWNKHLHKIFWKWCLKNSYS